MVMLSGSVWAWPGPTSGVLCPCFCIPWMFQTRILVSKAACLYVKIDLKSLDSRQLSQKVAGAGLAGEQCQMESCAAASGHVWRAARAQPPL